MEQNIDDIIDGGLAKSRSGIAWVVYSTVPTREIAAAFTERENAGKLHEMLAESEGPVALDVSEIDCEIDEFRRLMRWNAQLFFVVLENGEVVREDTFDDLVFNLRKPASEPGHPEIFAGTFWAFTMDQAIKHAQRLWAQESKK